MQLHISKQHQQGATLIVALVFLVVLTAAGVTAMRFASVEERMASNSQFRNQSFQLAQSEIRAQLLAFNQNQAGLNPLHKAMGQAEITDGALLLSLGLPSGAREPLTLDVIMPQGQGIDAANNNVRLADDDKSCNDGSSLDKFDCIKFEINTTANSASGTDSWQTQGLIVQINK